MSRQMARPVKSWDRQPNASGAPRLLVLVVLGTALLALIHIGLSAGAKNVAGPPPVTPSPGYSLLTSTLFPTPSPRPTPLPGTPEVLPIGIVAGHWGNDTGAICDGWLREVDVNLAVAQRVVAALNAAGYPTDLLEEFDPRLEGYRARALVSIHADACLYPEASGFKVARVEESAIPHVEDQLVACLVSRYGARTGLSFHEGSVTPDMTQYHAFYEIDPYTPGAVIEIGFLLADRDILLNQQDLIAQGIVDGILCFLRGETP